MLGPSFLICCPLIAAFLTEELPVEWSTPVGEGFSRPVAAQNSVYVSDRVPGSSQSGVVAVDLGTGEVLWRTAFEDSPKPSQENYGGGLGPHATPAVDETRVYALGFSGTLVAVERRSGSIQWSVDLVKDHGAKPVQFGFGASPIRHRDLLCVMAGGTSGVMALEPETGETIWQSPPFQASYVTPEVVSFQGEAQLVCLFESETVGLDLDDGEVLWSVPHVRPGLTNYAMLHSLDEGGLIVSGQGNLGTRCLDVARNKERWDATVRWHARAVRFSHGRIIERNGFLFGSNGSMLCALATRDGALAFKLRGFGEFNLVNAEDCTVQVDEEGTLALLDVNAERVLVTRELPLLQAKAWASPTLANRRLLARDAEQLVALRLPENLAPATALRSIETGYQPGKPVVPPALLAYCEGDYRDDEGARWTLELKGDSLRGRIPSRPKDILFTPRSENQFTDSAGGTLEVHRSETGVPDSIEWQPAEGPVVRARKVARAQNPVEIKIAERWLGRWSVDGSMIVEFQHDQDQLVARASVYDGVIFAVTQESPTRLWLEAQNATYGIPDILLVQQDDQRWAHQATNTYQVSRALKEDD